MAGEGPGACGLFRPRFERKVGLPSILRKGMRATADSKQMLESTKDGAA